MKDLSAEIQEAVRILKKGGIVAYPTDTVYGLGASIDCSEAVARIFAVKSRPREMALPLLVGDAAQMESLAGRISASARCLIEAFLPGAVTLVMPASPLVPGYLRTREGTVALRIPDHPVPLALIAGIRNAIVGTSANLSGRPSPVTAAEVHSQLGKSVDLIIDGGGCGGKESTIIDVTGEVPAILRGGAVGKEEIERVCGAVRAKDGGA